MCIEAHPTDEFPGEDPATALPAALSAALKGLAHEVRNPLAGLKGAAQLLARRVEGSDARELVALIDAEVDRLADLVERLLNPAPPRPSHRSTSTPCSSACASSPTPRRRGR